MKGMNAHVNTRSGMVSTAENTNAEKNKNLVTGALGKGRTPFSDISNSFQRPNIQQTKKSALIQAHSKPSLVEARTSKPVISKPVIQPKQQLVQKSNQPVEEIVVETPVEDPVRKRSISTTHMNLRQTKRRKSEEMEVELQFDVVVESPKKCNWEDIDANDFTDPSMVSEYVTDIYEYLGQLERNTRCNPKYMANQADVTEKMRAILVDWLVEVHKSFTLLPETLFLTLAIIDRYLEAEIVKRDKLQLIGVTALLIASKYEEIYAPEVSDFVYIVDGAYSRDEILDAEEEVLATLKFNVNYVSPLHFLRRFSKAAQSDYRIHTLCKYIIEITMVDIRLLRYLPSEIAIGALYLARAMTHIIPIWNPTIEHYTTYTEIQARDIAIEINKLLKRMQKSSLKSISNKYSSPKCGEVANIPVISDL